MKLEYHQQLAELADHLVSPERFGRLALLPNLDYKHDFSASDRQRISREEQTAITQRWQWRLAQLNSETYSDTYSETSGFSHEP